VILKLNKKKEGGANKEERTNKEESKVKFCIFVIKN